MNAEDGHLDGNAAAGALAAVFATEVTVVATTCGGCGNAADIGALMAYISAIGTVLRCPQCEAVLLRIVETPNRVWLDLRGMRNLSIERHA